MRIVGWMILVWAGCGGGTEATRATAGNPARPVEPAAGAPTTTAVGTTGDPIAASACDGATGLVVRQPAPIVARWDGQVRYGGEGPIEVHWCGAGPIEVVELTVGDPARWVRTFDPGSQIVRRDQPLTLKVHGRPGDGTLPATLLARDEAGAALRAEFVVTTKDDPARTAAIAACTACRGTWGAVGIAHTETCDCPTADAGKRCVADADCESVCIATGWERVEPAPADACRPGESREELVGRCHDRQHAFGCRPRVTSARGRCVGPGPRLGDRLPTVCTD